MKTKIRKTIKGYAKIKKSYSKRDLNLIFIEQNKKNKIISKLKTITLEMLKIFLIFNLINIMQFFIVHDEYVMNIFFIRYIKEVGMEGYIKALGKAFNQVYWLSLLMLISIYYILYSITNRKKISLIIVTLVTYSISAINYIVTDIRGSALTILDIFSVKTVLNVANGISLNINSDFIIGLALTIIVLIITIILFRKNTKLKVRQRIITATGSVLMLLVIINSSYVRNISIWNMNDAYSDNGIILTLARLVQNLKVQKPKGYNKSEVQEILAQYKSENNNEEEEPNIIVIMNESFADYTKNSGISMYEDNIPYFHKLQKEENVITGTMHSDSFGGFTANIEYEFLTQNTIAFIPKGATPYQQYINKNVKSIVTTMNKLDYKTYAIHLWNKSGYSRDRVYKQLDFDEYKFKEDYEDLEYGLNEYTTDRSSYSKIIDILETKQKEEKIFSFNVTVQNHIPYDRLDENSKTYHDNENMNIYLQMENNSDLALAELISYLKEYDEKIVLLFFGDHQPNTEMDEIIEDEENKYKVPYLIWANYDIEEIDYVDTSANYLQSILMKTAKLWAEEYTNYMSELRNKIPVLTANYYIGDNGEKYNLDDINSPYYEKIKEYEKIVYYQIFDN